MKINLHTHSNYSLDGEYDVNELINFFIDNNFDIISIIDHDTCEAYKHIQDNPNIKVITGIEADAIVNNHTYDFLCYNFKLDEVYNYAKDNNLLVSCGSDYHGSTRYSSECEYLNDMMINDILKWI